MFYRPAALSRLLSRFRTHQNSSVFFVPMNILQWPFSTSFILALHDVVGFLLFCLNCRIQLKDSFNKVGLTTTTWYDVARPMSRNMHGQIELSLKFTLKQV
jgi:hypothetical protein